MSSTRMITLFTEPETSSRGSLSIAGSAAVHVVIFAVISVLLVRHVPVVNSALTAKHSKMQVLNLDKPDAVKPAGDHGIKFSPRAMTSHTQPMAKRLNAAAGRRSAPVEVAAMNPSPQTLVQPAVQPDVAVPLKKPVPTVVQMAADAAKTDLVAPAAASASAAVTPVLTPPNHEVMPAEVKISSTAFPSAVPVFPPSTTTVMLAADAKPVVSQVQGISTASIAPANAAQVVSLSDLRIPDAGIALPRANSAAASAASTATTAGATAGSSDANGGGGSGSAKGASGAGTLSAANATAGAGSADRIEMPKNGQFGVVVVGASLDEDYPEAEGLWGGRMPFTVYVHVGLAKSWILQYSLPPAANAAAAGVVTHLEAPWPYDIERPNLAPGDINADALMVHGYVNKDGHFTTLAVVSPQQFPQEKFVLDQLRKWQFRPAEENGQDTDVEVLLIIPDELD